VRLGDKQGIAPKGVSPKNPPWSRVLTPAWNVTTFVNVPARKIQVGQVWKRDESGESFLVTKIYNEALTTFAVLRKAGAETEPPIRVKVTHSSAGASLPGFTYTQESDNF
jgi:hypothetical protein